MGLPEAPRPVSVGNCHLAVFLLGFAAAIWHFRGATTCFYWASKLPSSLSQQPFNALLSSTPSELCHGSRGPANCFCWPSHELLQHGPGACLCAFPLPLQSFKSFRSDALPLQLPKRFGNTNCFCWASKLLSLTLPRRHNLFLSGFETAIWHVSSTP